MKHSASSPAKFASLTEFIQARQRELGMNDNVLAASLGFTSENVLPQIKQGSIKFPLNKIAALATAFDVDSIELMNLHLAGSHTSLLEILNDVLDSNALSPTETRLIRELRKMTKGRTTTPLLFDGSSVVALVVA